MSDIGTIFMIGVIVILVLTSFVVYDELTTTEEEVQHEKMCSAEGRGYDEIADRCIDSIQPWKKYEVT